MTWLTNSFNSHWKICWETIDMLQNNCLCPESFSLSAEGFSFKTLHQHPQGEVDIFQRAGFSPQYPPKKLSSAWGGSATKTSLFLKNNRNSSSVTDISLLLFASFIPHRSGGICTNLPFWKCFNIIPTSRLMWTFSKRQWVFFLSQDPKKL